LVNRRTPVIFGRFAVPNEVDGFHVEGDAQAASSMSTERLWHYVEHASKGEQRSRLALNRAVNDYSQFPAPAGSPELAHGRHFRRRSDPVSCLAYFGLAQVVLHTPVRDRQEIERAPQAPPPAGPVAQPRRWQAVACRGRSDTRDRSVPASRSAMMPAAVKLLECEATRKRWR
jgi:hypothetical protein